MSAHYGRRVSRLEKLQPSHHKVREAFEASADAAMANEAIIHAANLAGGTGDWRPLRDIRDEARRYQTKPISPAERR